MNGLLFVHIFLKGGGTLNVSMPEAQASELLKAWRMRTTGNFIAGSSPVIQQQGTSVFITQKTWEWCVKVDDIVAMATAHIATQNQFGGWQGGMSGG